MLICAVTYLSKHVYQFENGLLFTPLCVRNTG